MALNLQFLSRKIMLEELSNSKNFKDALSHQKNYLVKGNNIGSNCKIANSVSLINSKNILNVVGIVGTTVVPYNLFLHAALVNKKYKDINSIKLDTIIAVSIGAVISICIVVTSASLQGANITNPSEISGLLEPFYGNISTWIINLGFFC